MYSPRAILEKQPVAIASAVRAVLMVAILVGLIVMDEKQLAGIALSVEVVLGLFAWHASTPIANPTLATGTTVSVANSDDKVVIEKSPPGPTGIEGEVADGDYG